MTVPRTKHLHQPASAGFLHFGALAPSVHGLAEPKEAGHGCEIPPPESGCTGEPGRYGVRGCAVSHIDSLYKIAPPTKHLCTQTQQPCGSARSGTPFA